MGIFHWVLGESLLSILFTLGTRKKDQNQRSKARTMVDSDKTIKELLNVSLA